MISLGFRNFGAATSSSSPHLSLMLVQSKFVSSMVPYSMRTRPSLSDLRVFIPTFIVVGLMFVFRTFLVVSVDSLVLDFTMILYRFSKFALVTSEYSFLAPPRDGCTCFTLGAGMFPIPSIDGSTRAERLTALFSWSSAFASLTSLSSRAIFFICSSAVFQVHKYVPQGTYGFYNIPLEVFSQVSTPIRYTY